LVGDSIHTSFVFGDSAASSAPSRPQIDLLDHAADRLEDLVQDPVGAAVDVERNDDLVARLQVGLEHRVLGGEPRPEVAQYFTPSSSASTASSRARVGLFVRE
jgi:hypothetical protein